MRGSQLQVVFRIVGSVLVENFSSVGSCSKVLNDERRSVSLVSGAVRLGNDRDGMFVEAGFEPVHEGEHRWVCRNVDVEGAVEAESD